MPQQINRSNIILLTVLSLLAFNCMSAISPALDPKNRPKINIIEKILQMPDYAECDKAMRAKYDSTFNIEQLGHLGQALYVNKIARNEIKYTIIYKINNGCVQATALYKTKSNQGPLGRP